MIAGSASGKTDPQRLCLFEVRCIETFGEPAVDRCQKLAGFGAAALVAALPSETDGNAQWC